ncbi:bacteriocin immunity protein [Pantoea sp. Ap-967]|uniref:bacteriocin immunity protein n=1 Tax=Pantoea sp. Ap-967 TaxID=2608362 RepID=UPI001422B325|nr:bacteriocin immunity protein [Pantoea sp. Ap-967]NIE74551.1 bacteriocin immunity protein [Pantoea sp. Ap-967]
MRRLISDYTEREFFDFVYAIFHADPRVYPTDRAHTKGILEFKRLSGHPSGSDVIFRPRKVGIKDSPADVVKEVKRWRAEQGLPGFKDY